MSKNNASKVPSAKPLSAASAKPKARPAKAKPAAAASQPVKVKTTGAASGNSAAAKTAAISKKTAAGAQARAKPVAQVKPAPEVKEKIRKPKLVRDSFTMPETEYQVLRDVKKACLKAGIDVKKSELLRVGVALLKAMDTAKLTQTIAALPPLKAGRPKKEK